MIVVVPLALFACILCWGYGEFTNQRHFRLAGSIGCVALSALIATAVSVAAEIGGRFQTSVDLTGAVETYHTHLAEHLKEGRIEFAITELEHFKTRAHATYEAGGYMKAVAECTERLKAGPAAE